MSNQNCQVHGLKTRFGVPKSERPPCDPPMGANGKTSQGRAIEYKPSPPDSKRVESVIWSVLVMVQFQKNWLLSGTLVASGATDFKTQ